MNVINDWRVKGINDEKKRENIFYNSVGACFAPTGKKHIF